MTFCVALDKPGNISATVQVNSEEQLEELQVLLKGDSPDIKRELNITAVMLAPKEAKQTEEDRPLRMVPGKISGQGAAQAGVCDPTSRPRAITQESCRCVSGSCSAA